VLAGFFLAALVAIPLGFRDRHVAGDARRARSLHPGDEADLAAGLDAAGALHDQGLIAVGDLRDLHLLAVADADQYRASASPRSSGNG
jgi:hypothetical protein